MRFRSVTSLINDEVCIGCPRYESENEDLNGYCYEYDAPATDAAVVCPKCNQVKGDPFD